MTSWDTETELAQGTHRPRQPYTMAAVEMRITLVRQSWSVGRKKGGQLVKEDARSEHICGLDSASLMMDRW